ncbi:DUF2637 domain-containing protein [Actinomadura sp. 9N407]|uniref:DUF2637 domain-containing protein n=1 Tax=Actinomadura sp. 9N407 TaxID=3375154 RepID=UPI0037916AA8
MPADPPALPEKHRSPALLAVAAGLAVTVLAAGAFVLTFDLLRDFAVAGRASRRWAPAYPIMVDALLVMTVLALIVARGARWWSRWLRGALLLLLVAGTAAISVQHALWGFGSLPRDPVRAGVAVAPHLMLIIAVWLWLRMIKQLRQARPGRLAPAPAPAAEGNSGGDAAAVTVIPPGEHAEQARPTPPPLALLPSDVEVARRPGTDGVRADGVRANTTQPDMIMPITLDGPAGADGEPEVPAADRAEDPDAGDDDGDLPIWDWDKDPPSGSLRSSPVPPAE